MAKQYKQAFDAYEALLSKGVKAEQARLALPLSLMSEFYGTVNLNNLIKFLVLRSDNHAQKEIREYADAIKILAKQIVPHVGEYLKW